MAIPKTGTQSVRAALSKHLKAHDWQQEDRYEAKRFPIKSLANIGHGHLLLREVKPYLGRHDWQEYKKFAFVRNPWDRFISIIHFKHGNNTVFRKNPLAFMKLVLNNPGEGTKIMLRPQYEYIYDDDGTLMVDHIGKFENLQHEYEAVCRRIGIDAQHLAIVNETIHQPYWTYYDEELKYLISKKYARDISLCDYKFGK